MFSREVDFLKKLKMRGKYCLSQSDIVIIFLIGNVYLFGSLAHILCCVNIAHTFHSPLSNSTEG